MECREGASMAEDAGRDSRTTEGASKEHCRTERSASAEAQAGLTWMLLTDCYPGWRAVGAGKQRIGRRGYQSVT